ncbi:MAG: hypothetical protein K0S93_1727 [Nitrososphaeraceae archaeon]|jgi:hypothetical protein|nr:hypothetical protein [Nitrososphaeraceae archaeon]
MERQPQIIIDIFYCNKIEEYLHSRGYDKSLSLSLSVANFDKSS